eukprot:1021762-Pyramimonas_sp.AAC.1
MHVGSLLGSRGGICLWGLLAAFGVLLAISRGERLDPAFGGLMVLDPKSSRLVPRTSILERRP